MACKSISNKVCPSIQSVIRKEISTMYSGTVSYSSNTDVLVKAIIREKNPLFQKWQASNQSFLSVVQDEISKCDQSDEKIRNLAIRCRYSEIQKYVGPQTEPVFDSFHTIRKVEKTELDDDLTDLLKIDANTNIDLRVKARVFWSECPGIYDNGFSEELPCSIEGRVEKIDKTAGGASPFGRGPARGYIIRTTKNDIKKYMCQDVIRQYFQDIRLVKIIQPNTEATRFSKNLQTVLDQAGIYSDALGVLLEAFIPSSCDLYDTGFTSQYPCPLSNTRLRFIKSENRWQQYNISSTLGDLRHYRKLPVESQCFSFIGPFLENFMSDYGWPKLASKL